MKENATLIFSSLKLYAACVKCASVFGIFVSRFFHARFLFRSVSVVLFIFLANQSKAQICGTSGIDGPTNVNTNTINTYFPVSGEKTLPSGSTSILLEAVPATDAYGNNYGVLAIRPGDLILIIQMQDAQIRFTDNNLYGGNKADGGIDGQGGTGYTDLGNSGKFEYVIALNMVPITGGTLNFRGARPGGGLVNTYVNAAPTATRGQRRFQIVRVPQYSNLTLTSNITTVPYNGKAGGVIAFDVAGDMNFNGFRVDASEKGFRGGFGPVAVSEANINDVYVGNSSITTSVGKGEGIAGTPRYMFDGYKDFDNNDEGLPGGSFGKGAPANGGGGGNDHNAGGGGGGNGGEGGVGGRGWEGHSVKGNGRFPNGGRPGSAIPSDFTRLIMGGGGGGGDANNASTGVKGGVGGGIILINVERITGVGTIISNGGRGQAGSYLGSPDGAGGGGAGGTIFVRSLANSSGASLTLQANGGNGGNTERDGGNEHGPGGGGGGGVIYHNVPSATVTASVNFGVAGKADSGNGTSHYAADGTLGLVLGFSNSQLEDYLKGGGQVCYPNLTTNLTEANPGVSGSRNPGSTAVYTLTITNATGGGNAGSVQAELKLPTGFSVNSITATTSNGATGPINPVFQQLGSIYTIGSVDLTDAYNISPGGIVTFTINVAIANNVAEGLHHASAQATYLDPTRTSANPNRRVTAKTNAFTGSNTAHETGNAGDVDGVNYNGNLNTSTGEDVHINAKPIPNNLEVDVIECSDRATGRLTASDADAAHTASTLVYTLEGTYDTNKGNFNLQSDGVFEFVPATRFFGTITIQFRVTDPLGAYGIGTLKINQPQPLLDLVESITHISAYGANDGAITVVSSGGVGAHTYSWLFPNGATTTTKDIANVSPGEYKLTVTDVNSCSYSEIYIVREPPLITLLPTHSICIGEQNVLLPYSDPKVNPTSYSIVWNAAALSAGLMNVTDTGLPAISPPATTANIIIDIPAAVPVNTYSGAIKVKNAAGDSSADLPFSITVAPYPARAHVQLVQ